LHGTKGTLQEPLSRVFWFCYGSQSDTNPTDTDLKSAKGYDRDNARFPRTVQKVARMLSDLNQQGYTSFIQ
jgi:hypothetical protein